MAVLAAAASVSAWLRASALWRARSSRAACRRARSRASRASKSSCSLLALAVRSRTAPLRFSSNSTVLPGPGLSFTVPPDLLEKLVQLLDDTDGLVNGGDEFRQVFVLE